MLERVWCHVSAGARLQQRFRLSVFVGFVWGVVAGSVWLECFIWSIVAGVLLLGGVVCAGMCLLLFVWAGFVLFWEVFVCWEGFVVGSCFLLGGMFAGFCFCCEGFLLGGVLFGWEVLVIVIAGVIVIVI